MSNIAAMALEQALTKTFDYMKHKIGDTSDVPKSSSFGLKHLLDIAKFVENYADASFLPWVAENDPSIDEGGSVTFKTLYDDLYFHTSHLLAECGHGNRREMEKLQEKFTEQQPWYVDDLHVTVKIIEMLIDDSSCEV